ncbi:hypothetical protein AABB24_028102 [Solanum stoloniferum]|uniref:Late blight resistance protein n=1 Tax=Solanum stoloniferum TaxID=62892 RepID=A0ABD2S538_9SOLN
MSRLQMVESLHEQKYSYKTHKRVDGRPLDDDSAKALEMINEKMSNSEGSTDQPPHRVACKGDVYSQFPGADSGHGQIAQTTGIPSVAENTPTSHGHTVLCSQILLRKYFSTANHRGNSLKTLFYWIGYIMILDISFK